MGIASPAVQTVDIIHRNGVLKVLEYSTGILVYGSSLLNERYMSKAGCLQTDGA